MTMALQRTPPLTPPPLTTPPLTLLLLLLLLGLVDPAVMSSGPQPVVLPVWSGSSWNGTGGPQQQQRRRRLGMDAGLAGNTEPLGYFYTRLRVGTPGQDFNVIVDTGSALLAVPCAGCTSCGQHMSTPFDAARSSSFRKSDCASHACSACDHGECTYHERFVEGSSIAGKLALERIGLLPAGASAEDASNAEPSAVVDALFGCQTSESGYFKSQDADGILGLGRGQVPTLLDVLSTQGPVTSLSPTEGEAAVVQHGAPLPDTIQFCIGRSSGQVALGVDPPQLEMPAFVPPGEPGAESKDHLKGLASPYTAVTALRPHKKHYIVSIRSLAVGDTDLGIEQSTFNSGQGVLLDSGTSLSYFPRSAYRRFLSVFQKEMRRLGVKLPQAEEVEGATCWSIALMGDSSAAASSGSGYAKFPDLHIQFGPKGNGISPDQHGSGSRASRLRVRPTQYIFVHPSEQAPTHYCLGVLDNGPTGVVLGAIFMRHTRMTIDRRGSGQPGVEGSGMVFFEPDDCGDHLK